DRLDVSADVESRDERKSQPENELQHTAANLPVHRVDTSRPHPDQDPVRTRPRFVQIGQCQLLARPVAVDDDGSHRVSPGALGGFEGGWSLYVRFAQAVTYGVPGTPQPARLSSGVWERQPLTASPHIMILITD